MAQYLGLIIFLLPTYLVRFQLVGIPFTLLEILVLGAIGWFFWRGDYRILWQDKAVRQWIWLGAAWIVVGTISWLVSPDGRAAAGIWKAYIVEPVLLFFVFLVYWRDEPARRAAYYGLAGLTLGLSALLAGQWLTGIGIAPPWDQLWPRRATGWFGYPNANALLLAPSATLLGGLAWLDESLSRRTRLLFAVSAAAALLGLFFVHSAGGLVGLAVGFFVLLAVPRVTRWLAGGLVAIGGVVVWLLPRVRQELLFQDWSGSVHWWTWQETINMLRDHWLLGAGLAGYKTVFAPYHLRTYLEIFMYPHNLFLNFWSELGLAGLFLFILIIRQVSINIANVASKHQSISNIHRYSLRDIHGYSWLVPVAAFITLLTHGLVDVPFFKNDLAILFWLLIALMVRKGKA